MQSYLCIMHNIPFGTYWKIHAIVVVVVVVFFFFLGFGIGLVEGCNSVIIIGFYLSPTLALQFIIYL